VRSIRGPLLKLYHTGVLTSNSNPFYLALCSGSRCFVLLCAIALGCPRTWAPFSSRSNRPMFGRRMRGRYPQDSDTSSNVNTEFNFEMEIQKQLGRSGEERISMNSSNKFLRATIPRQETLQRNHLKLRKTAVEHKKPMREGWGKHRKSRRIYNTFP
jgi:hypothetical protein